MKTLAAFVGALLLAGCACKPIIKTEIVPVDKPVVIVPKPPKVPEVELAVDKLTPADATDPGKVGQAYKHDMLYLRQVLKIYQTILKQYDGSSQNFDQINKEIDDLFKRTTAAAASAASAAQK